MEEENKCCTLHSCYKIFHRHTDPVWYPPYQMACKMSSSSYLPDNRCRIYQNNSYSHFDTMNFNLHWYFGQTTETNMSAGYKWVTVSWLVVSLFILCGVGLHKIQMEVETCRSWAAAQCVEEADQSYLKQVNSATKQTVIYINNSVVDRAVSCTMFPS